MKRAVIIQGPTTDYSTLKDKWGSDIIWSTWKGEESHYSDNDIVIFNDIPNDKGRVNVNLQKISTINGLKKAKELGYTRAIKTRSDLHPTNFNKFISLFKEGLNIPFFHDKGYYIDYIYEGDIDLLIKCFSFNNIWPSYPEQTITEQINKVYTKENIHYYGNFLNSKNDLYWIKRKLFLSSYISTPEKPSRYTN